MEFKSSTVIGEKKSFFDFIDTAHTVPVDNKLFDWTQVLVGTKVKVWQFVQTPICVNLEKKIPIFVQLCLHGNYVIQVYCTVYLCQEQGQFADALKYLEVFHIFVHDSNILV